jgi:hypothetical protein
MEISMDCPSCEGRITFRSSNPRFAGATTGHCGLCATWYALTGGVLHTIGARSRRPRRCDPMVLGARSHVDGPGER